MACAFSFIFVMLPVTLELFILFSFSDLPEAFALCGWSRAKDEAEGGVWLYTEWTRPKALTSWGECMCVCVHALVQLSL